MTIKKSRKLLKGLPSDMEVALELANSSFVPVCEGFSNIIEIEDIRTGDKDFILLLQPCTCENEDIDLSHIDKAETLN